jgi:3-hydroxyacyl-CoA dehydrogenase/enoyl-CoA hydratase/3-hydroxybutyryl-CoA epimerase
MGLVSGTIDWSGFATCDLVVEAIVEKLDIKRRVLAEAEEVLREDAIFATNTSSLRVSDLAATARHPGRVVGLHFFNPAPRMPLVEVVAGRQTDPAVIVTATAFTSRIGKVPVVVRDGPGFLVNRLLMPYLGEAIALAEGGADPAAIDRACVAWGLPMGPFRLLDEIGLDVARHAAGELAAAFPQRSAPSDGSLDRLVEAGRMGAKSGLGFYRHPGSGGAGSKGGGKRSKQKPEFDPEVLPLLRGGEARELGESAPQGDELIDLLILPIINEAAQCLADGIVRSARDVDLAMVMGTGFPPFRGGPLRYADSLGLAEIRRRLDRLAGRFGERLKPAPHLLDLVSSHGRFHS